ncbi:MAG TPA: acyltransferase [Ferruginibacter sp.]|jgi:peptidoglycan/LPS O-acetylase OafA/YrhL|nr:acyltransferase [Ferruginibacter sp.]
MATPGTIYFKNLDALRFLAFLGVFIAHTIFFATSSNFFINFFLSIVSLNYFGVPFFFTLSSFLITYRLLLEREKNGSIRLLKFYKNRILRIWPIYYLLVFFCFFALPFFAPLLNVHSPTLPSILPFLFFYVNLYIIENGSFFTFSLMILWSISIEEQFYLVWSCIVKFVSNKRIVPVIFFLFAASVVYSYYYLYREHKAANNLAINTIYTIQNFCTGALIALVCIKKQKAFIFLQSLPSIYFVLIYILLPVSFFFIRDMVLCNIIKSICYSLIIYDQTFNEQSVLKAGKYALINYLGKISYGLYIYHAIIIIVLEKGFHFFIDEPILWINMIQSFIALVITVIIAHISYQYIELKFLALKSI